MIVLIAAICYSGAILMTFCLHIINGFKVTCSKFDCNILTNNKNQPIVCMAAIRYIRPIWLVPPYLYCEAIRDLCAKFHQETSKNKKHFYVAIDGRKDRYTDGETDELQTDRQTDKQTQRQTHVLTERLTDRQMDRQMERQIDGQNYGQNNGQTDKHGQRQSTGNAESIYTIYTLWGQRYLLKCVANS